MQKPMKNYYVSVWHRCLYSSSLYFVRLHSVWHHRISPKSRHSSGRCRARVAVTSGNFALAPVCIVIGEENHFQCYNWTRINDFRNNMTQVTDGLTSERLSHCFFFSTPQLNLPRSLIPPISSGLAVGETLSGYFALRETVGRMGEGYGRMGEGYTGHCSVHTFHHLLPAI